MSDPFTPPPQSKWEQWIKAISIGAFILAAIGIFFYAAIFQKIAKAQDLLPHVAAIIVIGIVLMLLNLGYSWLKVAPMPDWAKTSLAIGGGILIFAILVVVVIAFAIIVFQTIGVLPSSRPIPQSAPQSFGVSIAETYLDKEDLPPAIFGDPNDDIARAREWMKTIEAGARPQLNNQEVKTLWIVSKDAATNAGFAHSYSPFTAHLQVGTEDDVVAFAYLIHPDTSMVNLKRLKSDSKSTYQFDVPPSDEGSRLFLFVAMTTNSYAPIQLGKQKIELTTR